MLLLSGCEKNATKEKDILDILDISDISDISGISDILVGYDRYWIIRPETGSEPEFQFWLTGTGIAFKNSGSS